MALRIPLKPKTYPLPMDPTALFAPSSEIERGTFGLFVYQHPIPEDSWMHNAVNSIIEDKTGKLWFGTRVIKDKKGNIWTNSQRANNGGWVLSRYDEKSLTNEKPTVTMAAGKEGNYRIERLGVKQKALCRNRRPSNDCLPYERLL